MDNLISSYNYNYHLIDDTLLINYSCFFKKITDDKDLRLRIFSKKTFNNEEIKDPNFFDSSYIFNINKSYSFKKIKFLFKIKNFDDLEYLKIGLVKEGFSWINESVKTIHIDYKDKKSLNLIINKFYLKYLNRPSDEGGLKSFSNLVLSKAIKISDIPEILINSEEYLLTNRKTSIIEDINFLIECPANRCDGYGNSAHYFCENLSDKSKIRIIPTIQTSDVSNKFSNLIIDRNTYGAYNPKNYLFFNIPNSTPFISDPNIKKYILTMFESTKIPSSWPSIINSQFDNLLVPSDFCKEIFINNGIKIPTDVINLGVDPDLWPFYERNFDKKNFKFLLFANAHWENTRKNYQLTLDAFTKVFGNNPNVSLTVKLTAGTKSFNSLKYKNVNFIYERYNHSQMLDLVNSSDCMVFVSNGEGFGLPPREAMSTGMPVILMNWSSLSEICKDNISYWINPSSLQPAVYPPEVWTMNNGSSDFGEFAKGSVDDLAQVIKHVYLNREEAFKKGMAASKYIRDYETYDIATNKLINIMENK